MASLPTPSVEHLKNLKLAEDFSKVMIQVMPPEYTALVAEKANVVYRRLLIEHSRYSNLFTAFDSIQDPELRKEVLDVEPLAVGVSAVEYGTSVEEQCSLGFVVASIAHRGHLLAMAALTAGKHEHYVDITFHLNKLADSVSRIKQLQDDFGLLKVEIEGDPENGPLRLKVSIDDANLEAFCHASGLRTGWYGSDYLTRTADSMGRSSAYVAMCNAMKAEQ